MSIGPRNEGHQSQPIEIDAGDSENDDGIEMEGMNMCVVRLAYILTALTIIRLEPVRSEPQPSIIPDKPSSHNSDSGVSVCGETESEVV